jgi:lipoprotein-anchoring transpeptidase ErfK/SrfK
LKPIKLCTILVIAAMLAAGSTPSMAQDFFENLRKSFNNIAKPPPATKQASSSQNARPQIFKNLKRAFADISAAQIAPSGLPKKYARTVIDYQTREAPGTIIIDPREHYLYFVLGDGRAVRYGVGVGRDGFGWRGTVRVGRKAEWPGWTPPPEMVARERRKGIILPAYMEGGVRNPLGARALYLYNGGGDTAYRIHGSNEPWTIGRNVSSGCFRMVNKDVIDLYNRARVGAKVIVL